MYAAICSGSVSAAHTRSGAAATSTSAVAVNPVMPAHLLVSVGICMTHSYNNPMGTSANPRLDNLLAALVAQPGRGVARPRSSRPSGLAGSAALALLALEEFLGDAHVGRLADVLGLTHSGAVRLVSQLEAAGLAERRTGGDRRRVEVRLTAAGRRRAACRAGRPGRGGRGDDRRADQRRGRRPRTTPHQARRGARRGPRRAAPRGRRPGLVVPDLRLRGVRAARGPLPGPGDRRGGAAVPRLVPWASRSRRASSTPTSRRSVPRSPGSAAPTGSTSTSWTTTSCPT